MKKIHEKYGKEIDFILDKSKIIILLFLIINVLSGIYIYKNHNQIISNNKDIWTHIGDSTYSYELAIPISNIYEAKKMSKNLSKEFIVKSIFNEVKWSLDGDTESNMITNSNININKIKNNINKYKSKYKKYITDDYLIIYFMGNSKIDEKITNIINKNKYKLKKYNYKNKYNNTKKILFEIFIIYLTVIIVMKIIFKTFHSGIILSYISISILLSTISIIHYNFPNMFIDLNIIYIIIIISLIDFLYFQYRWVIFSDRNNILEALKFSVLSNIKPAFWTSFIIFISLSLLFLLDSFIVKVLAQSIIISSILTFLYNVILFPVMSKHFSVRSLKNINQLNNKFTKRIISMKFNNLFSIIFISISSLMIVIFLYFVVKNPNLFLNLESNNNPVVLTLKDDNNIYHQYKSIKDFSSFIKIKYNNKIKTYSFTNEIDKIDKIDSQKYRSNKQKVINLNFQLEINNMKEKIKLNDKYLLYIYGMNKIDKIDFVANVLNKSKFEIIDIHTKVINEKVKTNNHLSLTIVFSIILLTLLISLLFKNFKLFFYTFLINTLPIVIFSYIIYINKIPMTFELMVILSISFAFTADSIIHINYRYWKSRNYYGFDKFKSIQETYLFTIIPMIISSILIIIIFSVLYFIHPEYQNFSIYLMSIISISLFIDIFIYPILLINSDDGSDDVKNFSPLKG